MARNQPSYDFLAGGSPPPSTIPVREQKRRSTLVRPDAGNEELRAQVNTLQYELDSLRQERQLEKLNQERELRDAQSQAEEQRKLAQTAKSASDAAGNKHEALAHEIEQTRDDAAREKAELERKLRSLQDTNRSLQEEAEDAATELASGTRTSERKVADAEARLKSLQSADEELQNELKAKTEALQSAQQKITQQESENGQLEAEILKLKAAGDGGDETALLKRELSEQVAHIRKMEIANRQKEEELQSFRKKQKAVEVIEEEKRGLEAKLRMLDDVRRELDETRLQKDILEDQKRAWSSYLESDVATSALGEGEESSFETPEDLARALVKERLESASLLDQLGSTRSELKGKEQIIRAMEDEKTQLQAEVEKAKANSQPTGGFDPKIRARLERQRALATKEAEYLRAQLQTFEAEESEFTPEKRNADHAERVSSLENLVEEHRKEVQLLTSNVSELEKKLQQPPQTPQSAPPMTPGSKRPRDADDDERLGELQRKNRTLQEDHHKMHKRAKLLEADLKSARAQLESLKSSSRTRILELRQNPTADAEALKMTTLRTLQSENKALLARLEGDNDGTSAANGRKTRSSKQDKPESVPYATLEAARLELDELNREIAKKDKMTSRLKSIWSAKSLEFREAVASILGWKMDFMPNGRVRVTSMFNPGDEESDGGGNSIVFDGENGTMKVSGGPQSIFAGEIRENIAYWVEGKKEIPCFLAALTLEFWERRAGTVSVG